MQKNCSEYVKNNQNPYKQGIYMDYQASTPLDARVLDKMIVYMTDSFGNPHSSEHIYGWNANKAIEKSKSQIASYINALDEEIIFTSGATESNNMAIIGLGYAALERSKKRTILVSEIEHKCVLGAARFLERFGFNIKKIPIKSDGLINLEKFKQLLTEDVLLVSVMSTNNEIGTEQPISEIGSLCKNFDTLFHVDAAQGAFGELDVIENKVDLMSLSAHKIYGPKGIGALYINQSIPLKPLPIIHGGGQQDGYRSGTLPTFLIVGMGEAAEIMKLEKETEKMKLLSLREQLLTGLQENIKNIKINGSLENRHPGNLNILLPSNDARQLILSLQPQIAFSTGSACTSGIQEPSHVLKALGLSTQEAERSFRITVGRFTDISDINAAITLISDKINKTEIHTYQI